MINVIAVPRRFYKDFKDEDTRQFKHRLSILNQQMEELAGMRFFLFEFVGLGQFLSGNASFILDKDGDQPDDKGTKNLVRVIQGRIPRRRKSVRP